MPRLHAPAAARQCFPRRTGSEIVEAFTATERGVRLVRGEAYFTVKKGTARPFIVRAGALSVRAVGTAFNVRLDATSLAVLVTDGLVRLNPPAALASPLPDDSVAAAHLAAGQRVVLPATATQLPASLVVETVSSREIRRALAWHDTPLVFEYTPLSVVVSHFNRRNLRQLVLAREEGLGERPGPLSVEPRVVRSPDG